jgi:hypothetical protein
MHNLFRFLLAITSAAITATALAQAPKDAPKIDAPQMEAPKPAVPAPRASTIQTFGKEKKQTVGKVTDIDKGDNGCYITFVDERKNEFVEVGTFALCDQKPSPKGKMAEFTYSVETIQAASCYGDKNCTKTETIPIITSMKLAE